MTLFPLPLVLFNEYYVSSLWFAPLLHALFLSIFRVMAAFSLLQLSPPPVPPSPSFPSGVAVTASMVVSTDICHERSHTVIYLIQVRALRVQRSTGGGRAAGGGGGDPNLLMMGDGKAFHLSRRLMKSLFGAVFHGVQGVCPDLTK